MRERKSPMWVYRTDTIDFRKRHNESLGSVAGRDLLRRIACPTFGSYHD